MFRSVPGACVLALALSVVLWPPGAVHFSWLPLPPPSVQPLERRSRLRSLVGIGFTSLSPISRRYQV